MATTSPNQIEFLQNSIESLKRDGFTNINLNNVWEFVKQCMVLTERYINSLPKMDASIDKKLLCIQLVEYSLKNLSVSDLQKITTTVSPTLNSFIEVIIEISKVGIAINQKTNCWKKFTALLSCKKK